MSENDDFFMKLPEGFREKFMQKVVSRTSPGDAARVSCVSKMFRSVADSNSVWDSFILQEQVDYAFPDEHKHNLYAYDSSKKLFIEVADTAVFLGDDDVKVAHYIDKLSGKRWLQLHVSRLSITYLDTDYWIGDLLCVVEVGHVVWLEIKGKASTANLSPNTTYTAYLLYTFSKNSYGFHLPVETSVGIVGEESINRFVYLDPAIARSKGQYLTDKNFFEVELGDYFHKDGENRVLEMTVREVKSGKPKCGVGFFMIELRPKRESINPYHQTHSYIKKNTERREGEMSKEGEEGCEGTDLFSKLPQGFAQAFMEEVVSRTSPVEACRLSVVAKHFRAAAESDVVWDRFLPSDYQQFFCWANTLPDISFASKKDLYLFLVGNPLHFDSNIKSFWLDKWSGKKCFMIPISFEQHRAPRGVQGKRYNNGVRFKRGFIEVHGKISTSMLSSDMTYTALLVHQINNNAYDPEAEAIPFEASVGSSGDESVNRVVYLQHKTGETGSQYAVKRTNGWLEVELGEYFNKGGENKDLEISVSEVTSGLSKSTYIIEGIEIRPKRG